MSLEENLLNKTRELSFNLLEMPSCFKLNTCNYTLSEHMEISASINTATSIFGIDIEDYISSEFTSALVNKIIRKIDNTQSIEFIDRRGIGDIALVPFSVTRDIVSEIINRSEGYDNIVCNGIVASILQDDYRLHLTTMSASGQLNFRYMYQVGVISGIKVWVDPIMRYDDYKIIAFNNVGVNVNNFSSRIVSESTVPRLIMEFDTSILYDDVKKIYLIVNNYGDEWSLFMQHNRNSKINDILDEEE